MYCRQIRPSDNNVPGKCLSDSANEINRRKLLINAEVTAVTTLIELIGGVTFIIHLYYAKGNSFPTLLHSVIYKCAIMPYVFLMNTSHNKSRIIERGWKNVFQNFLKPYSFAVETVEMAPKPKEVNSIKPKKEKGTEILKKRDTFAISSSENKKDSIAFKESLKQSSSCSCSCYTIVCRNCIKNNPTSDKLMNQVWPILDANKLGQQKYIECMSSKLVYNLEKNLENEKMYIESFKKLLKFSESCKKGNILSEKELENKCLNSYACKKEVSKKKSKRKRSQHSCNVRLPQVDENHGQRNAFLEDGCIREPLTSKTTKEKESRLRKRVEILHELQLNCKESEIFNQLFDRLIDMEECFISESKEK